MFILALSAGYLVRYFNQRKEKDSSEEDVDERVREA